MSAMILVGFADIHGEPFLTARLSAEIAAADRIQFAVPPDPTGPASQKVPTDFYQTDLHAHPGH